MLLDFNKCAFVILNKYIYLQTFCYAMKAICSANALIELSDEKKQTINKTVVFSSLCVVFFSSSPPLSWRGVENRILCCFR